MDVVTSWKVSIMDFILPWTLTVAASSRPPGGGSGGSGGSTYESLRELTAGEGAASLSLSRGAESSRDRL